MSIERLAQHLNRNIVSNILPSIARQLCSYYASCSIGLCRIPIDQIVPLSRIASSRRLTRWVAILSDMMQQDIDAYEPVITSDDSPPVRLVLPPIVERHSDTLYLFDGTHRLLAARSARLESVSVLLIQGSPLPPLPCAPSTWASIAIQNASATLDDVLHDLVRARFRALSILANSELFTFPNRATLLDQSLAYLPRPLSP